MEAIVTQTAMVEGSVAGAPDSILPIALKTTWAPAKNTMKDMTAVATVSMRPWP